MWACVTVTCVTQGSATLMEVGTVEITIQVVTRAGALHDCELY